jgi:hypothetical protein
MSWESLALALREAREELDKAEVEHARAVEMLKEAQECFRAAKGAIIEYALAGHV